MQASRGHWTFILLLGILTSCGGGVFTKEELENAPPERASAILLEPELANVVEIQDQNSSRDTNLVFLAETLIVNKTTKEQEIEVRCQFKNEAGFTLESSPWKKVTLEPFERYIFVAPSIRREITRFLTQIRSVQ
ncbi:MAG: hypothetical protein AAF558_06445 [Verrucomicrobiota bacterium]